MGGNDYLIEWLAGVISLAVFIGLYMYHRSLEKFEKIARPIREINKLSNPEERYEKAFANSEERETVMKMTKKEPSDVFKVVRYFIMGLVLLTFLIIFSHVLLKYIDPLPALYGKIGSGLATLGVMFISLGSWSIQTYKNNTKAERLRDILLMILWSAGALMIFLAE